MRTHTPLIIRTSGDIRALLASPKIASRLPPGGPIIDIPHLDMRQRDQFRREIKIYTRACGCAAGGATFLVSGAACLAWAGHLALNAAWIGFVETVTIGAVAVVALTFGAKFLGVSLARARFRRSCARLLRLLSGDAAETRGQGEFDDL